MGRKGRIHLWLVFAASPLAVPGLAQARRYAVGLTRLDFA